MVSSSHVGGRSGMTQNAVPHFEEEVVWSSIVIYSQARRRPGDRRPGGLAGGPPSAVALRSGSGARGGAFVRALGLEARTGQLEGTRGLEARGPRAAASR